MRLLSRHGKRGEDTMRQIRDLGESSPVLRAYRAWAETARKLAIATREEAEARALMRTAFVNLVNHDQERSVISD
jgi:hypothetical protein